MIFKAEIKKRKPAGDENALPRRCVAPLKEGPLKGITVDHKKLAYYFCKSMGWDEEILIPSKDCSKTWVGWMM